MVASFSSCGTSSFSQVDLNRSVSFSVSVCPPILKISIGIESAQGDLPLDSWLVAFFTSSRLGGRDV